MKSIDMESKLESAFAQDLKGSQGAGGDCGMNLAEVQTLLDVEMPMGKRREYDEVWRR